MSEEIKFDLDKDIIMQIEMDSYMKYNDTIASMNDRLGEIYGYSDVKDMEEAQLKYEKELAYKAIKDLQQKVQQLVLEIDRLNNIINELEKWLKMIPKYFMDKRSLNNGVYIEQGMQKQIDLTLDKLKALKEDNKNE